MKTLILISAAISLQLAAISQAVRVTNITGRAAITGNTCPNEARKEALDDAKLNALKAAGIAEKISCYQSLQTDQQDNDNNQSFQSHIQSDILGDVKYDTIISEGMVTDTNKIVYYQVTINALVTPYAPDPVVPYTTDVTPPKKIYRLPPKQPVIQPAICRSDYSYNNGDSYSGQFACGKRNGYGTYHWANGSQYTGYYKDGLRDGPGVFYGSNGKVMTGIWTNGVFTRYQNFASCQGAYANRNNYSGYGSTGSYGTTTNNNYNNVQQQQQQPPTPQQKLDNDQSNFAQDVDAEQQKIEQ